MKIYVVLQRSDVEQALLSEIKRLRAENERLYERLNDLENKYGYETTINNELIDVLREYHIPFRQIIDGHRHRF